MAKFSFYEISCGVYNIDDSKEPLVVDNVKIQITKKVNNSTMKGEKGEMYTVPAVDIPYLFGIDVKLPARSGDDCTRRIEALKEILDPFVSRNVYAEEISKGKSKLLTSLEFID